MLSLVFSSSTASGVFRNASTSASQTSEEEHRIEQEYLGVGEVGGSDIGGTEVETIDSGRGKRNSEGDLECMPGSRRVRRSSGRDKYDALMDAWSQSMIARKEKDLAKAERYKSHSNEATSSMAKECWFYWELHGQVYKQKQKMTECLGLVWVNV